MEAAFAPVGWHTITPRLVAEDPATLIRFLIQVFDARGDVETNSPSVMRIGDSLVMVSGSGVRAATRAILYIYVENADATYDRAIRAGATTIESPIDTPYGDRRAIVRDPAGNEWQVATHLPNARN